MSSVLGLIDIKGTFLFHKDGEILNADLAACLKKLNSDYNVNFHLFTTDGLGAFKENSYMGIPAFWGNYGEIAGLSTEAIFGNGIFDITNGDAIVTQSFDKSNPFVYRTIANHYQVDLDKTFLLDDSKSTLLDARLGKVEAIHAGSPDYILSIENFVIARASPR